MMAPIYSKIITITITNTIAIMVIIVKRVIIERERPRKKIRTLSFTMGGG